MNKQIGLPFFSFAVFGLVVFFLSGFASGPLLAKNQNGQNKHDNSTTKIIWPNLTTLKVLQTQEQTLEDLVKRFGHTEKDLTIAKDKLQNLSRDLKNKDYELKIWRNLAEKDSKTTDINQTIALILAGITVFGAFCAFWYSKMLHDLSKTNSKFSHLNAVQIFRDQCQTKMIEIQLALEEKYSNITLQKLKEYFEENEKGLKQEKHLTFTNHSNTIMGLLSKYYLKNDKKMRQSPLVDLLSVHTQGALFLEIIDYLEYLTENQKYLPKENFQAAKRLKSVLIKKKG